MLFLSPGNGIAFCQDDHNYVSLSPGGIFILPPNIFNPLTCLTAGPAYIRIFIFIKYHILNMLKIKCDINQQDLKDLTAILSNLNNFHSLEVVDRVSETQLQVSENSDWII